MPTRVIRHPEAHMVELVWTGQPEFETVREVLEELRCDARFGPRCAVLSDLREIDRAPDPSEPRRLSTYMEDHPDFFRGLRWAVLAGSPVTFGIGRQLQSLTAGSGVDLQVFRDRDDALRWLRGRDDASGEP